MTPQGCFILTPEYSAVVHREIDVLVAHRNYSYESLLRMPVFSRKMAINYLIEEKESEKDVNNRAMSAAKRGRK